MPYSTNKSRACARHFVAAATIFANQIALAHDDIMEEVEVVGRAQNLIGQTVSASQGVIGAVDLAKRPILRSGELLEVIPGVVVTQHSGTGKANQYFLRGFNLDHGTDFAAFLDGVPLNLPTHGHGQGYLDLNPIIPELVDNIAFAKGPYYADVGDFSSAGYARYSLATELEPFAQFTVGEYDFYRIVGGASTTSASGTFLAALEAQWYDGPWELDEDGEKLNVLLSWTREHPHWIDGATFTAYDAEWRSTDQVPERAIRNGLISRLGNIDPTLGGGSTRYSVNVKLGDGDTEGFYGNAYAVYSDFELFSNFTYFLDDPIAGDQITQNDRRLTTGAKFAYSWDRALLGHDTEWVLGSEIRHDEVFDVALRRSRARRPLRTVRNDESSQTNFSAYFSADILLAPSWRARIGARADQFWFDVESSLAANSGTESDFLLTPKFALIYGPWRNTEWFLNVGQGFHSNDARGTVARVDPVSGAAADAVDPLVKSTGVETGIRGNYWGRLKSSVAVWYLELDSELVFVGDAGSTEASGESRRYGIEISNYFDATDWLTLDLDVAFTDAEFVDGGADEIPNSVARVITGGATVDFPTGIFGGLRFRHFGDSPLIEDGSAEANSTTVVNLRAGYRFNPQMTLTFDVFNLLGSKDPDISYFYESCLPSDPPAACGAKLSERPGVSDRHVHPVEPRALRVTFQYHF